MGTQQNILQQDEESRWACQKQSGKRLILRMDSSSRKIVMTSAHLPGAQWQRIKKGGDLVGKVVWRHRCPCTYWSVMLNSFWQLSNWISNKGQTAKGRISRHVDGEQGVRNLLRLLTPCDHVKFSRDGRWWNSTVKSHHPTHLVHTLRLRPTSGHCSWWEVLERPDHRGPRGNQRIHTRHSGVCSNRITSLFCLHLFTQRGEGERQSRWCADVLALWFLLGLCGSTLFLSYCSNDNSFTALLTSWDLFTKWLVLLLLLAYHWNAIRVWERITGVSFVSSARTLPGQPCRTVLCWGKNWQIGHPARFLMLVVHDVVS